MLFSIRNYMIKSHAYFNSLLKKKIISYSVCTLETDSYLLITVILIKNNFRMDWEDYHDYATLEEFIGELVSPPRNVL